MTQTKQSTHWPRKMPVKARGAKITRATAAFENRFGVLGTLHPAKVDKYFHFEQKRNSDIDVLIRPVW